MSTLPLPRDRALRRQPAPVPTKAGVIHAREIADAGQQSVRTNAAWIELVEAFHAPTVRLALTDVAAAELTYIPEAFAHGICPDTFPAKLTALLYERYVAFHGDPHRGVMFEPSPWLEVHGAGLCHCVREHAQNWALPGAFGPWIVSCGFPHGLVDSASAAAQRASI